MQIDTCISYTDVFFRHNDGQEWTLENINLTITKGEWISIIGPNGSGKSTFAKLLNGLYLPTEGTVHVNGLSTVNEESVIAIRRQVGMVFQNPDNQFIGVTVEDDVAFGLENAGIPREMMRQRVVDSLKKVKMLPYKDVEPHRLSGGQKQRVAIAGIIALSPQIIIFDEASSMLDPQGRKELIALMQQLHNEGMTIIAITHDTSELLYADRIIQFIDGKVTFDGTPKQLFLTDNKYLDAPFTVQMKQLLKSRGIPLREHYFTYEELIDELCKLT
jgi:energy-coupling factor transport system ATP-binding protein